jgi:hypothetical protein
MTTGSKIQKVITRSDSYGFDFNELREKDCIHSGNKIHLVNFLKLSGQPFTI